jgi:hypothetical protein
VGVRRKFDWSCILHNEQKNWPFVDRRRGVGMLSVSHNSVDVTSRFHLSTRHVYEPECLRLRLRRNTQLTTKNKAMNGDNQNRMAARMVSHPPCSRKANTGHFIEPGQGELPTVEISP